MAAALGYHQSKVSRLVSGRGTQDIRVDPEADDMHRRTFLAASIAALATPPGPAASHTDLVQALLPGPGPAGTGDGRA
ncbi:hypothetical protein J2Z21_008587 [Streptomyces griseochromogenes]|uniref:Uncharacterized protein n=1 Tax=Streptomyces griseochromogenes TaxID=68214 RepID=A0A1B1B3B6_9ACTN|nr:hypothetical protein AVL59_30680 [Streptomyces griseochromogenes]MBP2055571.1 hypothetical protein [Streptomyces griseochromogenes]